MTTKNRGFTLVELMLAMGFIAFLLLFIVSALFQAARLYTKGLAIHSITQAGGQITDSLTKAIRYSEPTYVASAQRLCVGGVTYVWNKDGDTLNNFAAPNNDIELRFVSVDDPQASLCTGGDIDKAKSRDLTGSEVSLLKFSLEKAGKLWNVQLVLSTSGSNIAQPDSATPTGFACAQDNEYCAFGDFSTSVYSRGR